jgi:hypothetical protein
LLSAALLGCGSKNGPRTYPGQGVVQSDPSIICSGQAVHPSYTDATYPCDASMDPASIRMTLQSISGLLFLAGRFANSELPGGGGCSKSTLCGQQYDPSLLLINDPSSAAFKTSANAAFAIPGIRADVGAMDVLTLMYDCLHNFPTGYSETMIPPSMPIMPVDDVRIGEALIWTGSVSKLQVYRARVVVSIRALKPAGFDLTGYTLTLEGGAPFNLANDALTALSAKTGTVTSVGLELRNSTDIAATATFDVRCMQRDRQIAQ